MAPLPDKRPQRNGSRLDSSGFTLLELVVATTLLVFALSGMGTLIARQSRQLKWLEDKQQDYSVVDLISCKAVFSDSDGKPLSYDVELIRLDCCPACGTLCADPIAACPDPNAATATVRHQVRTP